MIIERNSPFARETEKINMHISDIAYAYLDRNWNNKNARAAYTRIYYVHRGRGEIAYGDRRVALLSGNIYIIPAGLDFSYSCEDSLEKLYCHVNLFCYNRTDLLSDLHECVVLSDRRAEIDRAIACWRAGDVQGALQLKEMILRTATEAVTAAGRPHEEIRTYSPLIRAAVTYIEKNLRADLTATALSTALFVSKSRLQKTFRTEMGTPLGQYITARVLTVAEEKLRLSRHTIREISDSLGFCDRFYFSRVFAAHFGISPAKYRKNISL
ncbi:MAG: helix-turn-helix transcriptional regulator [Clostridia bacterium]|nr:helix-turn-helix transcriptional regulator [Clostridia bacterium]